MSDLVKQALEVARVVDPDLTGLIEELADEIERLRNECDALSKDCTTRYERHRQAVLDDLRGWNKDPEKDRPGLRYAYFAADLDDYEKDME